MAKRQRIIKWGLLLFIVIFAAALRLWNLSLVPFGFHGDEAVSGLEAQRIWRENGIGPYTGAALGQPTGPIYLTAVSIKVFGDSIFAVRLVSVIGGTLAVVVLYGLARRHFCAQVALLAALLLAITNWHLHFSRIGFPLGMWPLAVLLGTFVLLEAIGRRRIFWWMLAGATLCGGIYIYNAHSLFLAISCAFAIWCLWDDKTLSWRRRISFASAFCLTILLTAVPMVLYARNPENIFFSHFELYSLFRRPEWTAAASDGLRLGLLIGRYFDFWERLSWNPRVDAADGSGIVTPVPLIMVLLAISGLFYGWKTRRDKAVLFFALLIIFLPCAAVVTIDGSLRRTFALAPFIALLAAFGLWEIYRSVEKRRPRFLPFARVALAGLFLGTTFQTARDYFVHFPRTEQQSWAFVTALTEASHWMNNLPPDSHVYFLSQRWSAQYQTRQFIAPKVWIEDRSQEHGIFSLDNDDRDKESIWVLLDTYQSSLEKLRVLHPGGEIILGPPLPGTGKNCFVAYRLTRK
jgi:4-amino-4-deoxy-L-arabinose transferase-like glycosyltransferase